MNNVESAEKKYQQALEIFIKNFKHQKGVQVARIENGLSEVYKQNLLKDEALLFHKTLHHCRIREVHLCVNDVPVVFARSVLPTTSSTGINRDVLQLGSKPLGEVLFKKGSAPILLRQITEVPGLGWGRRSLYQLRGHPILISEFFLPELLDQIKS